MIKNQLISINKICFVVILLILSLLSGCIENDDNSKDNQNQEINDQQFIGIWKGMETKNNIPLNITLRANNTGMFDEIEITWNLNESILELGMFSGESPSYYEYIFSNNYTSLKLSNMYSNEIFELTKN